VFGKSKEKNLMSIKSHFDLAGARLRGEVSFWEEQAEDSSFKPEAVQEILDVKENVEKMLELCELLGEFLPQILEQSIADQIATAVVDRDNSLPPASTMGQAVESILTREGPMRYSQIMKAVQSEFPHLEFKLGSLEKSLGASLSYAVKRGKIERVSRGIYRANPNHSSTKKGDKDEPD
jgi:hypothetical protein